MIHVAQIGNSTVTISIHFDVNGTYQISILESKPILPKISQYQALQIADQIKNQLFYSPKLNGSDVPTDTLPSINTRELADQIIYAIEHLQTTQDTAEFLDEICQKQASYRLRQAIKAGMVRKLKDNLVMIVSPPHPENLDDQEWMNLLQAASIIGEELESLGYKVRY
jgi:hypothetical protein